MQTAGNHSTVHVAEEKDALPVVTLTLFRRKMHNSPVTVVHRCICKLQGRTIMRRLRSQDSSGKQSLVSSCVVHGRPCVPEGSGNASET